MPNLQFWLSSPSTGELFGLYEGPSADAAIAKFREDWDLDETAKFVQACLVDDLPVGTALLLCTEHGEEFLLQVRGQAERYATAADAGAALVAFLERPLATLQSPSGNPPGLTAGPWQTSDYSLVFLAESLRDLTAQLANACWSEHPNPVPGALLEALLPKPQWSGAGAPPSSQRLLSSRLHNQA